MKLIFLIAFLLFVGCVTLRQPGPDWIAPVACTSPGRMVEADHAFYSSARCYACENEHSCYASGDHFCCATNMCNECEFRGYLMIAADGGMKGR